MALIICFALGSPHGIQCSLLAFRIRLLFDYDSLFSEKEDVEQQQMWYREEKTTIKAKLWINKMY